MVDPKEGHIVKRFDEEMQELHDMVLKAGGLVRDQIRRAVRTLQDEDANAARSVIARDAKVNAVDNQVESAIEQILARRQPMASDLREIISIGKIIGDLERVGDEAKKIARLTIHFFETDSSAPNYQLLQGMSGTARLVERMLQESLDAFDQRDVQKACEVIRLDMELDGEFRTSLRHLMTFVLEDARTIGHFIDVVLGVRALERIGGHAKNIGGRVIYVATGLDVRHEDYETIVQELGLN